MIALLLLGAVQAADPIAVTSPESRLRELVADPADALLSDEGTTRGHRIVAMSNAAEACVRLAASGRWSIDEARDAVARLAATAADPRFRPFADPDGPYGADNLYVTHWLIVLVSLADLDPLHQEVARAPALARHLATASLAHPSGVARSFERSQSRWPADQAATLYALTLADRAFALDLAGEPIARYAAAVGARDGAVPGLPVSEWTGGAAFAEEPRGSAVAWSVRYLADVAPEIARRWWQASKPVFQSEGLGLQGFREWPEGQEHPADVDSGPILMGMSAAATAFAIGASRAVDDCPTFHALARTQAVVQQMVSDPQTASTFGGAAAMRRVQQTALAAAITANQATLPTRCPPPPPPESPEGG